MNLLNILQFSAVSFGLNLVKSREQKCKALVYQKIELTVYARLDVHLNFSFGLSVL